MGRFVRPETTTLHISQGDTLVVKKRLNAGERRRMYAAMALAEQNGPDVKLNPFQYGITKILAFLVDWSLRDDDGKPVVILNQSADVVAGILDALESESFKEILDAIEAHEIAMKTEREAEKNVQNGATESPAISPSLVA